METNENYIRWQSMRISQLGFANNLLIGLAAGLIAFTISFVGAEGVDLSCFQKVLFWLGGFCILFSLALGLFVVLNRLEDFRITAQIALKRERNENADAECAEVKRLGKLTWRGFKGQVILFVLGFLLVLVLLLTELSCKVL